MRSFWNLPCVSKIQKSTVCFKSWNNGECVRFGLKTREDPAHFRKSTRCLKSPNIRSFLKSTLCFKTWTMEDICEHWECVRFGIYHVSQKSKNLPCVSKAETTENAFVLDSKLAKIQLILENLPDVSKVQISEAFWNLPCVSKPEQWKTFANIENAFVLSKLAKI